VLLQAHCLALKAGPERLHQALQNETQRLSALLMAYQTALEDAAAAVTRQADASAAQGEALGQRLEALERLVLTVQAQEHAARAQQDEAVRNACAAALSAAEGFHQGRRSNLLWSFGLVIALTALATTLLLHWLWGIH
jgi:transposase